MSTTSISHFTHPKHELVKTAEPRGRGFTCDMCKAAGSGDRYRCDACDFDLHEHCAACPDALQSFSAHPAHPLNLVPPPAADDPKKKGMMCDLCYLPVLGYSYRCAACAFDLHPLCSRLPQTARSELHPNHPLTLHPSTPGACAACGDCCFLWRYRCGLCMFDLHTYCLDGAPAHGVGGSSSGGRSAKKRQELKRFLLKILVHTTSEVAIEMIANMISGDY